jgi:asparagine synthase (glutamine-hydrolysing)
MQGALRHRGPDDAGIWQSPDGHAGFVHTRLAILDLSAAGHQPMASDDGRYTITFNGEIYNFRALRAELEAEGQVFRTNTDTEVILKVFARDGAECVRELEGMFSFAIWDSVAHSCFMARDPLGIKPLYYYSRGGALMFASEVRALLSSGLVPRALHPPALFGYLMFGSVQEPDTLLKDVHCLPAGHWLEWRDGTVRQRKYWDVEFKRDRPAPAEPAPVVRRALSDSVSRHLVSDVPVGIFLSGGVDSTALLALAREEHGLRARTFCISFDDPAFNEGDVAARTAAHFGADHSDLRLDALKGRELLREFLDRSDQPSVDGFNTFCVASHAASQGMKVVLSGLGGDELFGGYQSFEKIPSMVNWGRRAQWLGPFSRLGGAAIERYATQPRWRKFGTFLCSAPSNGSAYWSVRGIFTPTEAAALVREYTGTASSEILPYAQHLFGVEPQPTAGDEISTLEISRYMRNQLLRDSDVMSMAWGLELRVPFVDRKFIDEISSVPASARLKAGKQQLLDAVPEMPEWVVGQPKRGFTFPFEQWLRQEWGELFCRGASAGPVPLLTWYRRWCLFALEDFLRKSGCDAGRAAA